jgi:hypothetical protein
MQVRFRAGACTKFLEWRAYPRSAQDGGVSFDGINESGTTHCWIVLVYVQEETSGRVSMQRFGRPMTGLPHRQGQGEEIEGTHSLDKVILDET